PDSISHCACCSTTSSATWPSVVMGVWGAAISFNASLMGTHNLFQGDHLIHQVGAAAFIKNAHMVIIDHGEAGITGTDARIEQNLVGLRPGLSVIGAVFDRHHTSRGGGHRGV